MNGWRRQSSTGTTLLWLLLVGVLAYWLSPTFRQRVNSWFGRGGATVVNLASQTKEQMGQYIDLSKFMKRKKESPSAQTKETVYMTPDMGDMNHLFDENMFGSEGMLGMDTPHQDKRAAKKDESSGDQR